MKKFVLLLLCFTILLSLSSCGSSQQTDASLPSPSDGKIKIVTTIFPIYDWVKQIIGDRAEIKLLMSNGVDLHNFQPTVDDIITITDSDVFIYVGGESDTWVEDILARSNGKKPVTINLIDLLGSNVKEEEIVPGMQEEDEDHKDHEDHEDHEDHHHTGIEYDEHVWLSLKNADIACSKICSELCSLDSENSTQYQKNYDNYSSLLQEMDSKYSSSISGAKHNTVLFGDRFPFRYLTDDYGIEYYAAFVGCSAESEASFETIIFLANKVDELSLPAILKIETSDGSIAETIRQNTSSKDQKILEMNSMQSCTDEDIENGLSYLQIMDSNLSTLLEALS
ncbi:MAG: zinc ABC transporter substrate-binding protein [Oscillospiraceae bacterium]|nr:zinc ABC transporter substrate-binding protein [Oscillospiraceae bacterium]